LHVIGIDLFIAVCKRTNRNCYNDNVYACCCETNFVYFFQGASKDFELAKFFKVFDFFGAFDDAFWTNVDFDFVLIEESVFGD